MNYSKHSLHVFPAFGRSAVLKVRSAALWRGEGSRSVQPVAAAVPASSPAQPVQSLLSWSVSLGSPGLSIPCQSTRVGRIDLGWAWLVIKSDMDDSVYKFYAGCGRTGYSPVNLSLLIKELTD